MTAPIEGNDFCTSEVVSKSSVEGASKAATAGNEVERKVVVVVGNPDTLVVETTDLENHVGPDETANITAESCKGKQSVEERVVSSKKLNHPGITSAKTGKVDRSSGGVIHLIVDITCFVSQSAKIKKGVYSASLRPTSDCDRGEEGSKCTVTGDRVANTDHIDIADKVIGEAKAVVVLKSVEAVAEIVKIVKSPGTDLKAVASSPLIKGLGKGGIAVSSYDVATKVQETDFESVADGESQPDVVAVFEAVQAKRKGSKAVGQVNIPTPFRTEVGNTGHKTVQCSGGHVVHGFTSQGSNVFTNDSLCGRNVDEAHKTSSTIVRQLRARVLF